MLIPLSEYARQHGRTDSAARYMALRGSFKTARKIGRNWVIDDAEPYPDHRVKNGDYTGWREQHNRKDVDTDHGP